MGASDEKREGVGSRLRWAKSWADPADGTGWEEAAPSLAFPRPDALIDRRSPQPGPGQAELSSPGGGDHFCLKRGAAEREGAVVGSVRVLGHTGILQH